MRWATIKKRIILCSSLLLRKTLVGARMNATINNGSETKIKNLELRTTSNELRETINDKKKKNRTILIRTNDSTKINSLREEDRNHA